MFSKMFHHGARHHGAITNQAQPELPALKNSNAAPVTTPPLPAFSKEANAIRKPGIPRGRGGPALSSAVVDFALRRSGP
ncbi:unnamed protein product [Amoebophrya sp. A120]|nr:unnamed protein product [Amoebophrya sp. A120]|eukprot:GSA120T00017780001.1